MRTTDTTWDAETRGDFLAEIEQEADRLARLVETLIDIARIDAGGLDPTSWGFSAPAALVEAGIDRVRASLGERALDIHVPDDVPAVWVDATQIEQVIANLLENAAKYSPATEAIGVVVKLAEKSVMFRIEDRGLGIPAEHLERVFEAFFREPKGQYPATGDGSGARDLPQHHSRSKRPGVGRATSGRRNRRCVHAADPQMARCANNRS